MKIVCISDLHYGHKRIPGEHIYRNLKEYVYPKLKECDLLFICGDTFHSLLDFNHEASKYVIQFFNELFYMSKMFNFGIRILRGTYSHDRKQVGYIKQSSYKYLNEDTVNLKCFEEVAIDEEIIKDEHLKVLYLPDDLPYKSQEECLDHVRELLESRKWKTVDIIIAHGYCFHTLPAGTHGPAVTYSIEQLSAICDHLAIFGHVHTPSIHNFEDFYIIYVGSFERMNHGEEGRKGFITIDTDNWETTFCENKNTLKFLTHYSNAKTVELAVDEFKQWIHISNLSEEHTNFIRVSHSDADVRQLLGKILRNEFPQYRCVYSTKVSKINETIVETSLVENNNDLVIPTEDNIVEVISKYIKEKNLPSLDTDKIENIWNLNFDEEQTNGRSSICHTNDERRVA